VRTAAFLATAISAVIVVLSGASSDAGGTQPPRTTAPHATSFARGAVHRRAGLGGRVTAACASGGNSFVAIGSESDVAGSDGSAVLGGGFNDACDQSSAIGAGAFNKISAGGGNAFDSFLGGGEFNVISASFGFLGAGQQNSTVGSDSFVGAGLFNFSTGDSSFVGAGGREYFDRQSGSATAANTASGTDSFVGAGDLNAAAGAGSFVGAGGTTYAESGATTGGNNAEGVDSFIGAGDQNYIDSLAINTVIGGGLFNGVNGQYGVIGGGAHNQIAGGGYGGGSYYGVVAGGYNNAIKAPFANGARYTTIAGGTSNIANGIAASIGGGSENRAFGEFATIPGGLENQAIGIGTLAAGTRADASHNGSFVWSDDAGSVVVKDSAPNQFVARASGGYFLYSDATAKVGVRLSPGSGSWASVSDRAAKSDVARLDDAAVLAKVEALPVTTWSYRSENPAVRHVGPMAQDFYASFHVGEDDRHITSIDEDGVALAAIKGLAQRDRELTQRDRILTQRDRELTQRVSYVQGEVSKLAAEVASLKRR